MASVPCSGTTLATQQRVDFHLSYSSRNVLQEHFLINWARFDLFFELYSDAGEMGCDLGSGTDFVQTTGRVTAELIVIVQYLSHLPEFDVPSNSQLFDNHLPQVIKIS